MSNQSLQGQVRQVIERAIAFASEEQINVYSFSFYLDHESRAISVCLDTHENSKNKVMEENSYNSNYFRKCIDDNDLEGALMWCANPGRNLSLGDFKFVNVSREDLLESSPDKKVCEIMLRTLVEFEDAVSQLTKIPDELLLSCSTANDELGLTWTIINAA
jgi:hypothetical protein